MAILILYGTEPYCIDAHKKKALKGIQEVVYLKGSFDVDILASCNTFSFFSEKKGIVLNIETLKELDTSSFRDYVKNPCSSTELVIICKKADARLKLFKDLNKKGLIQACNKVESEAQIQKVITYELSKLDARIASDAMTEFINRINYFGKEDMTLLTAVNYISAVAAVTKEIRKEDIVRFVPKFEEPNVFALVSLIKERELNRLLEEINLIPSDDAIGVLSLLLRSFRISFNCKFFPESSVTKGKGQDLFKECTPDVLNRCIRILTDTIYSIKSGCIPQELALKAAAVKLVAAM